MFELDPPDPPPQAVTNAKIKDEMDIQELDIRIIACLDKWCSAGSLGKNDQYSREELRPIHYFSEQHKDFPAMNA